MIKDTARIMIDPLCNKKCVYCCNDHPDVMKLFKPVGDLQFLKNYEKICITGGEPMLFPDRVLSVAAYARNLGMEVYLYTAQYVPKMQEVIRWLDGVTYTVHQAAGPREVRDFYAMQMLLEIGSSFCDSRKLLIDKDVDVKISPIWTETETVVWLEQCDIPENEDFYWYQG